MRPTKKQILGLSIAAAALIAAACGGSSDGGSEESGGSASATQPPANEKGLPKKLAANRAQANEIIDGGTEALEAKLAELEGHPVVVNQWASWCDPCREEFPLFRDSAESHAADVAFLGIDMQDSKEGAEAWLEELPVPYPHIFDEDAAAITSLGGGLVSPTTVYIDENGEIVQVFQGTYTSRDQLEQDIERNLLSGDGQKAGGEA